ncbi:MAG: PspC domain-containing protein [Capnocytophaga sp.]|nr:PspC domain-containing protein [Capnocytophaga sp.]
MDKIQHISLGGFSFIIENQAFKELSEYLDKVRTYLGESEETNEIMTDVEQRMAELLKERMISREVIMQSDIAFLINRLGKPEQYLDEEDRENISQINSKKEHFFFLEKNRKLYRDLDNKILGGVLSGISHYFQIDTSLLRFLYTLIILLNLSIFSAYFGLGIITPISLSSLFIIFYIIFWMIIPPAQTTSEKLEMKGKEVNIDTLTKPENLYRKVWRKSSSNKMLTGVLGGLAQYFQIESSWLRIGYMVSIIIFWATKNHKEAIILCILYFLLSFLLKKDTFTDEHNEKINNFYKENKISEEKKHSNSLFLSFFRFLVKFAGFFVIMIVFLVLFIIISVHLFLFLGLGFAGGISMNFIGEHINFILTENWQKIVFILCSVSAFLLPVSIFSLLIIKLFSKKNYVTPKIWFFGNIIAFFIIFLGIISLSISIGKNFIYEDSIEKKVYLDTQKDSIIIREKRIMATIYGISSDNEKNYTINNVNFIKMKTTKEKTPFLVIETSSYGKNKTSAIENAEKVEFPLQIDNNIIEIPNSFILKKGNPFRKQQVNITLYVPEGKKIVFARKFPSKIHKEVLPYGSFEVKNDSIQPILP